MKLLGKKRNGEEKDMGYDIEGRMQEICSCKTLCPRWVGVDPDGGKCDFEWDLPLRPWPDQRRGRGGMTWASMATCPENFDGNVRLAVLVDYNRASQAQQEALLAAFTERWAAAGRPRRAGGEVTAWTGRRSSSTSPRQRRFRAGERFEGEVEGIPLLNGTRPQNNAAVAPVLGYLRIRQGAAERDVRQGSHFEAGPRRASSST